jgi:hypothetical protein
LDYGLCDACFPKAQPAEAAVAVKTRQHKVPSGTARRSSAPRVIDDVSQQRIYHLTHIRNLPAILTAGGLVADAAPEVDISSPDARISRRTITVDDDGETVASYVPFFLSPLSDVWNAIRFGSPDPRLAVDDGIVASDFILLVSSFSTIDGESIVIADGDAAHPLTRFATTREAGERTLRKLRVGENRVGDKASGAAPGEEESGAIRSAELLVKDSLDLEHISLIAVANDRAKNAVKALLTPAGYSTRISIHPPWFAREA